MATLVLTTVGTALGGPLGGALGSLVGQSIDQQLFGPGMRHGPRLGDLNVQTSSYGSPIPRIYGTMRVAGTVVWATDLKEVEAIRGGAKGAPEQIAYSYSACLAVALSSRAVRQVKRIWADGKLIRGAAGAFKVRTKFRLHIGGEDQQVDPLIASVETIAQSPAYRGLALALFEDLELAEFGNRIPVLTFEVEADEAPVPLGTLLADASGDAIISTDPPPIIGFAAYGGSVGDSLARLVDLTGMALCDHGDSLKTPASNPVKLIDDTDLGCDPDNEFRARVERERAPVSILPSALSMTYYEQDRDYQSGQMRASAGPGGARDERFELPAVLSSGEAKALVERALARRWRHAEQIRLRLPPAWLGLRPGDSIQLAGTTTALTVESVALEGLAVIATAHSAAVDVSPLPADAGRSVTEPDLPVGRTELALFEMPPRGDAPAAVVSVLVAASNDGTWKSVPIEAALGTEILRGVAIRVRTASGRTENALEARSPLVADELSSLLVRLSDTGQLLFNADDEALMSGANLAMSGNELIQFGRAELVAPGRYRLSRLLRGRQGTEWAAVGHQSNEPFCMVDLASVATIDLPATATGALLRITGHGVGDFAPLPTFERTISGEALRPPSPWHLRLVRESGGIRVRWVRRSYRSWVWTDQSGSGEDGFPERYLVEAVGPGGIRSLETNTPEILMAGPDLPASAGQSVTVSVATIGPMALSHRISASVLT